MRKSRNRIILILLYLIVIGYSGYVMFQQQYQLTDINKAKADITSKIQIEKQKLDKLEADLKQINSDAAVEKIAREKLGLIKSDEKIFVDSSH